LTSRACAFRAAGNPAAAAAAPAAVTKVRRLTRFDD